MKLQCRSVGSLNEASERSPVFFNQFDHGIYWKYHAIYTSIIYLCDTMDGCQILHQLRDVVKSPWVSTIQGGAGFRNAARIHCSSFLWVKTVASLLEQDCFYVILIVALTCSGFWDYSPYSCPFANGPSFICSGSFRLQAALQRDRPGTLWVFRWEMAMKCVVHNPFSQ